MRLNIDGRDIEVGGTPTILAAARQAGIDIPSLCSHEGLEPFGGCRLCLVEIEGLEIDGEPARPESVIERGPEALCQEILRAIHAECGLSAEERKN